MANYTYIDTGGKSQTVTANDASTALRSAPNIHPNSGVMLNTTPTTPPPTTTATNPVVSSKTTRTSINADGVDIKDLKSAYDLSNSIYQAEQDRLAAARLVAIKDINNTYANDKIAQENSQNRDFGARSTNLITSGGGFLGATQSQQGVLQNLKASFEGEKQALMAKRDAAINAAIQAYEDKQFTVAKEMANNAKQLQADIYKREQDFADQQFKISAENRAQTEFDIGLTDKKVAEYSLMDDASFATVDPVTISAIDANYYPGYTARARELAQQARDVKTKADATKLDLDILDARGKIPYGQPFTIAGQTFTGIKVEKADSGSDAANTRKQITEFFSPGHIIPGTNVETVGKDGYSNPDAWKMMFKVSNLDRKDYIDQYGYLINPDTIGNYGLTPKEQGIIKNTLSGADQAVIDALKR